MPEEEEEKSTITIGIDLDRDGEDDFSINLSGEGEAWNTRLTWFAIGAAVTTLAYLGIISIS